MTGTSAKITATVLIIILATLAIYCRKKTNPVFEYLNNAEVQVENGEQRATLKSALNDITTLSGEELKVKRYRDYRGRDNQWDLPTLLMRHFLPDEQSKIPGGDFYRDVKSPEVMKLADELARRLDN